MYIERLNNNNIVYYIYIYIYIYKTGKYCERRMRKYRTTDVAVTAV
jgi:hypothetical protein